MANHEVFSSDSVTPHRASTDNDATDQRKHLNAHDGTKGASVADELMALANPEHDTEAHFSSKQSELARRQPKVRGEMKMDTEKLPVPPAVPKVDRVSGKVSTPRFDDDVVAQGGYQGWSPSEDPFEGGVSGTRFNDGEPASQKEKAAEEFYPAAPIVK